MRQNDPITNNCLILDTCSSASVLKNAFLEKNAITFIAAETLLMLKKGGHLYFNQMGKILLLSMTVHIDESSMEKILYSTEVASISGNAIQYGHFRGKSHQCSHQRRFPPPFKACAEGIFCTNLDDISMITYPTNFSLNTYTYLSTVKQKSNF